MTQPIDRMMPHTGRYLREDGSSVNIADLVGNIDEGIYTKPADGVHLDAFGRQRVSFPITLFDSQQEYGLEATDSWDLLANSTYAAPDSTNASVSDAGASVGPVNSTTGMTPITSTVDGEKAVLQSRQYVRYIPGKGHFIAVTGIFADSSSDVASFVLRSSTGTGEREFTQPNWNLDPFDGTGPSGVDIDFTKTQILLIDAQALYVGRIRCGFDVNGIFYPAHQYVNANILTVPYIRTFNLPVRIESITDATGTSLCAGYFDSSDGIFLKLRTPTPGGTINFICCSVQSEGGQEIRGFPRGATNGQTTRTAGTGGIPVLSIRPKAIYNGRTNRAQVELIDYQIYITGNNDAYFEIIEGGTLNGAYASVGDYSVVEQNVTATTITGGQVIREGYAVTGSGRAGQLSDGTSDIRNPFTLSQIDDAAARQIPLTVVVYGLGGNATAGAAINWNEQTI